MNLLINGIGKGLSLGVCQLIPVGCIPPNGAGLAHSGHLRGKIARFSVIII